MTEILEPKLGLTPYAIGKKTFYLSSHMGLLVAEFHKRAKSVRDIVFEIIEQGRRDDLDNLSIRMIIDACLSQYGRSTIRAALPEDLKEMVKARVAPESLANDDKKEPEQSSQEQDIKEEKQFEEFAAKSYETPEPDFYENNVTKKEKQNGELREELDKYKAKVKELEQTNKDKEYRKLEEKIIKLEEINHQLLNANKQYSEAVVKHSFETATNVKMDPQQIKNYEDHIRKVEAERDARDKVIAELSQKLESFSHIEKATEHQPLEMNIKKFIGIIFGNRGKIVRLVHDGKQVVNIMEVG